MKVAVVGAGAVGGYFGARLADAGHDVTFVARGPHLAAMRQDGLRVTSINGDLRCRAPATDEPSTIGAVDLVLVGVKAWQVPAAASELRPLVGPDTAVLPLQNGVETVTELQAAVGDGPVLGGLCRILSVLEAPGHIRHSAAEPTVILGELDGTPSDRAVRIRDAFDAARVTVELSPDINTEIWRKFLFVEPWGAVGAVARVPLGRILDTPEARRVLEQALAEVVSLGRAHGAALADSRPGTPGDADRIVARLEGVPPDAIPSMQRDIMAGRPSELDAQVGAVVRLGVRAAVATPVHGTLYGCLAPMERAVRE